MKRRILALTLTITLIIGIFALSGCSSSKEIDFKELATVTYEGRSGSGYAKVDLDYDAIAALLGKQNDISALAALSSITTSKIDNNGSLSNGDRFKVTVEYNEKVLKEANLTPKNTELEFEVSGLEEKEVLDLFKDIKLVATPVNGDETKCTVFAKYIGDDEYLASVFHSGAFVITGENGNIKDSKTNDYFSIGEKVTISVCEEHKKEKWSFYARSDLLETSKEYTITIS